MRPIAKWLRETRDRHHMLQDDFRAQLYAETGWKLAHSNYSAYENDRQVPRGKSLQRFIDFWAKRGEPPPDLSPPPPPEPEPSLAAALIALTVELRESRLARERLESRLLALEAAAALQAKRDGEQPQGQAAHSPQPAQ